MSNLAKLVKKVIDKVNPTACMDSDYRKQQAELIWFIRNMVKTNTQLADFDTLVMLLRVANNFEERVNRKRKGRISIHAPLRF